ncbi:hypothetical protein LX14_000210 [Williamsia deligens]|nr:hypothetical protein [Williamsia deligens]
MGGPRLATGVGSARATAGGPPTRGRIGGPPAAATSSPRIRSESLCSPSTQVAVPATPRPGYWTARAVLAPGPVREAIVRAGRVRPRDDTGGLGWRFRQSRIPRPLREDRPPHVPRLRVPHRHLDDDRGTARRRHPRRRRPPLLLTRLRTQRHTTCLTEQLCPPVGRCAIVTRGGHRRCMVATGLEVTLHQGRERAEVSRFTRTLDGIVLSLREIDQVYLTRAPRATWVQADLKHRRDRRRQPSRRARRAEQGRASGLSRHLERRARGRRVEAVGQCEDPPHTRRGVPLWSRSPRHSRLSPCAGVGAHAR